MTNREIFMNQNLMKFLVNILKSNLPNVEINPLLKNQNHLSKSDEFLIGANTLNQT